MFRSKEGSKQNYHKLYVSNMMVGRGQGDEELTY
jgi:hypothetical protein